jgi:Sulfotransferase family
MGGSEAIRPIFIFSITRSGSTLLQRVIAAHEGVATVSEPWLLLPALYALRERGVVAEYTHPLMSRAVREFCETLPAGVDDYHEELRSFALRLYRKAACEDARYFVDKSPPYYFVANEVIELFPDAKFVFLWRNPLSVVASIIDTWQGGTWGATAFREDLFVGLPRLVATYREQGALAHSVRFEDLLGGESERHWHALFDYLELDFDPRALERFAEVRLAGRMGDQVGVRAYQSLDREPTAKWKRTLANPLRRAWCRRYIGYLGGERLALMGYDKERLLRELRAQPHTSASLFRDARRLAADLAKEPIRVRVRRGGIGGPNVIRELLKAPVS